MTPQPLPEEKSKEEMYDNAYLNHRMRHLSKEIIVGLMQAFADQEVRKVLEQVEYSLHSKETRIVALKSNTSKGGMKWFVEDPQRQHGLWWCLGEPFDSRDIMLSEQTSWTNDPLHAFDFMSKENAENWIKKFMDNMGYIVTDHLFIKPESGEAGQQEDVFAISSKELDDLYINSETDCRRTDFDKIFGEITTWLKQRLK